MDLKQFEVFEAGGDGWVRADRVMEHGWPEAFAEQAGEQLGEGAEAGAVRHGEQIYRWRWTEAARARRAAAARAELAARVRGKRGDAAAWLATEEGEALRAAAGFGRLRPREVLAELLGVPQAG